ncbi:rab proteins geranylgeranyltransferase component A [Teleopsis dalmanni]|uniref:rab proteins geranylgeranyltransferase component A n=1 Tax=Teleopsis dalmanni TaxID=139649 RepID=UPI0018CEA626|nr:rab proteins geranylgeranyltransferase component A [Teleopsis dalmanni]
MSDDVLPDEFDLVVIGTGFPESCIAAAASRIGKTVLHIDPNEFYGGCWASFSLEGLVKFLNEPNSGMIRNTSFNWNIPYKDTSGTEAGVNLPFDQWTAEKLIAESRRFNIDLIPKIIYSSGALVQLLVSSNICRYAEFRAIDRVCTIFHDNILNVPCSRSDVFNTKDLSIVEKRLLMKFLNLCLTFGENKCEEDAAEYRGKTFREYLNNQKVTEKISTCVMQAIAMCTDNTPFEEGMEQTLKFIKSLGRYGNTPFLYPMYGCGELPQCFCRLCAVFGGIYCLNKSVTDIKVNADTNTADLIIDGKLIRSKHVVCSHGHITDSLRENNIGIYGLGNLVNCLSRGVYLTEKPLGSEELNAGGGGVNVMRLVDGLREAMLIQLSTFSGTCLKGVYIMHLTTPAISDKPEEDLLPFTNQIFSKQNATSILCSAYFTVTACERSQNMAPVDTATPIYCTAAPVYEVDYDSTIDNARDIFKRMYEVVEFLPRAPDPDEIIVEGEDPHAIIENSLPEDLREQLRLLEDEAEDMDTEDATKMVTD